MKSCTNQSTTGLLCSNATTSPDPSPHVTPKNQASAKSSWSPSLEVSFLKILNFLSNHSRLVGPSSCSIPRCCPPSLHPSRPTSHILVLFPLPDEPPPLHSMTVPDQSPSASESKPSPPALSNKTPRLAPALPYNLVPTIPQHPGCQHLRAITHVGDSHWFPFLLPIPSFAPTIASFMFVAEKREAEVRGGQTASTIPTPRFPRQGPAVVIVS